MVRLTGKHRRKKCSNCARCAPRGREPPCRCVLFQTRETDGVGCRGSLGRPQLRDLRGRECSRGPEGHSRGICVRIRLDTAMAAAAAPPNSTDIQPVTYFRARPAYTGCPRSDAREEGAPEFFAFASPLEREKERKRTARNLNIPDRIYRRGGGKGGGREVASTIVRSRSESLTNQWNVSLSRVILLIRKMLGLLKGHDKCVINSDGQW